MLLLRLYPTPWRARYGDEFEALLLARPPSWRDRLDIVRGAIDARLQVHLEGPRLPRVVLARDVVLALGAATIGALFSAWAGIIVLASPRSGVRRLGGAHRSEVVHRDAAVDDHRGAVGPT